MVRKKILLSDDVELFLMLENTVYNRREFELITARSGQDIFKLVRKEEPELIFINLNMSDISGEECCRIVKEDDKCQKIPVIMVIPDSLQKDKDQYSQTRCDDFLHKPINRQEFLSITRKYLKIMERVDERFNARVRVKYTVFSKENYSDYSIDINTGGLFLETKNPFMINTPLDLEFQLPNAGYVIRCKGRGAWVNDPKKRKKPDLPGGMGVQFLDISSKDKSAITEYINMRSICN